MSFLKLAADRFSVRAYLNKPVEDEKMEKILEAGKLAPTACNLQPQKIYVLKSKEAVDKINSVCKCIYGAPVVLMICYDEKLVWKNPLKEGYNSGEIDSSIVCTHMMLEAWEQGIASCWVAFFNSDEVSKAFNLPQGVKPVALLPIGYAADGVQPKAECHNAFRAMEEIVTVL